MAHATWLQKKSKIDKWVKNIFFFFKLIAFHEILLADRNNTTHQISGKMLQSDSLTVLSTDDVLLLL